MTPLPPVRQCESAESTGSATRKRERGEWHDAARLLKQQNPEMSNAAIGRLLGVGGAAVWKVLNPERTAAWSRADNARRRPAKREWDRKWAASPESRGICSSCGNPRGHGTAKPSEEGGRCQDCIHAVALVRQSLGEGMWADGWSLKEMGEAFEINNGGSYFVAMRGRGWDLPYRYRVRNGVRIADAAPELQVAA